MDLGIHRRAEDPDVLRLRIIIEGLQTEDARLDNVMRELKHEHDELLGYIESIVRSLRNCALGLDPVLSGMKEKYDDVIATWYRNGMVLDDRQRALKPGILEAGRHPALRLSDDDDPKLVESITKHEAELDRLAVIFESCYEEWAPRIDFLCEERNIRHGMGIQLLEAYTRAVDAMKQSIDLLRWEAYKIDRELVLSGAKETPEPVPFVLRRRVRICVSLDVFRNRYIWPKSAERMREPRFRGLTKQELPALEGSIMFKGPTVDYSLPVKTESIDGEDFIVVDFVPDPSLYWKDGSLVFCFRFSDARARDDPHVAGGTSHITEFGTSVQMDGRDVDFNHTNVEVVHYRAYNKIYPVFLPVEEVRQRPHRRARGRT